MHLNIGELVSLCRLLYRELNNTIVNNVLNNHLIHYYKDDFINYNNSIFQSTIKSYMEDEFDIDDKNIIKYFKKRLDVFDKSMYLINLCEFGVCDYCKTIPLEFDKAHVYTLENPNLIVYGIDRFYVCNKCKEINHPLWLTRNELIKMEEKEELKVFNNSYYCTYNIRMTKLFGIICFYKRDIYDKVLIPKLEERLQSLKKYV